MPNRRLASGVVCGFSRRLCNYFPNPAANSATTMKNIEANRDIASGPIFSRLSASFANASTNFDGSHWIAAACTMSSLSRARGS
jgi:hypothetical protein